MESKWLKIGTAVKRYTFKKKNVDFFHFPASEKNHGLNRSSETN